MLALGRAHTLDICVRYPQSEMDDRVDANRTILARMILMRPATKYLQLIKQLFVVLPSDRICGIKKKNETRIYMEKIIWNGGCENEKALIWFVSLKKKEDEEKTMAFLCLLLKDVPSIKF